MADIQSRRAPSEKSQSMRMIEYLRAVLRSRGIRLADAAEELGVSEKSVKRYMSGQGVTLAILERLCSIAGIRLRELADLAEDSVPAEPAWTTETQEDALAADPASAIVFSLLQTGWSPQRILKDGLASEAELTLILVRLDRLGVLTLYPENRVRVRARMRPLNQCSEQLRTAVHRASSEIVHTIDMADTQLRWRLGFARLGPASLARATERIQYFLDEVTELSRQDLDLPADQVKWCAVMGLVGQHDILGLRVLRDRK